MLSLSYLRTQLDESFSKAELNKYISGKSSIKFPASTVIYISSEVSASGLLKVTTYVVADGLTDRF